MYKKAVDIWNEVCEKYPEITDDNYDKVTDNVITDVMVIIRNMKWEELKILAKQYLNGKPAVDAFAEVEGDATFRNFLEEVIYIAAVEYTI